MLYYFFEYMEKMFNLTGASVFQYISFRSGMAIFTSLLLTMLLGPYIIKLLAKFKCAEDIRDLGLRGQIEKKGMPTMGGLMIICGIVLPTLLFARIDNIYVILLLTAVLWMGTVGFLDDYIKVRLGRKEGLRGKFKIIGQVLLALGIGTALLLHKDITIRELTSTHQSFTDTQALRTTIPFIKNNELDYANIFFFLGDFYWIGYLGMVILIVVSVSNSLNITDGLDGLAAGSAAIIGLTLAIFAYLSGNAIFSDYLNIMYIPRLGEVVVFCAALVGACVGFLWYNSYPAQIFMGDTGSLSLGTVLAVLALIVRKELLLPLLCGILLLESASVIIQVFYFKYTKRCLGTGKRVLLMAPLHHHYQKLGWHESKIVVRFWTLGILFAILSLVTLKLR